MTIIDQYFEYFKKYSKKYGVKTAVLLESGSFFEIYKKKLFNVLHFIAVRSVQEIYFEVSFLDIFNFNRHFFLSESEKLEKFLLNYRNSNA